MEQHEQSVDYRRMAESITYLKEHFREQPSLEELAERASLSPFHFQRMFTAWAGVSPKQFARYLTAEYARTVLREEKPSLFDLSLDLGLSGSGRLHDLFIRFEGMSPGEYKQAGEGLIIRYSFQQTHFGQALVASTDRGICFLAFCDGREEGLDQLRNDFGRARLTEWEENWHRQAVAFIRGDELPRGSLSVHLRGTPFQLKVWEALLHIPEGGLTTYGRLAEQTGQPQAARAIGTAVGANPVAFLIPCHRVIRENGELSGYRWAPERKQMIIGWEAARLQKF